MSQEAVDEFESDTPVVVEDNEITNRPTNDRGKLSDLLQSLATKIFHALQKDYVSNQRYAIRLVIRNRLKNDSSSSTGKRKKREEFEIKLPYSCLTWNEMDLDDIEIQFFRRVVDLNDQYKWYKVKVRATHFISQETRTQIDLLEAEENPEAFLPVSTDTPASAACINNTQNSQYLNSRTCDKPTVDNDDDEDIEIICEIPKK